MDLDDPAARVLGDLGVLLLDSGVSVTDVRHSLLEVAAAAGFKRLAFTVLPEIVIVSDPETGGAKLANTHSGELSFLQAAHANRLVQRLSSGELSINEIPRQVAEIRRIPRRHAVFTWMLGSALTSAGLAILFRCAWWAIAVAAVVGGLVGLIAVLAHRRSGAAAILPFVTALGSTLLVGALAAVFGLGSVPLFAVSAPVAILVPGALITNALLELTAADIVTGSARLIYGLISLGFMAVGISTGAALTGLKIDPGSAALVGQIAHISADNNGWAALPPLWLSWIGVAILAIGIGLFFGAGRSLIVISVIAMTCTYALLVLLTPVLGSVAAAGIVAGFLFIFARILERFTLSIPATVSFQPAFLLLVPGTVGLVAVATFDSAALSAALTTFVSICIGIKVAALIVEVIHKPWSRRGRQPGGRVEEPSPN
ncbi:hypothetical protein UM93_13205 [Psychromicrobium lacuslunae]|uniref:Threonine/serine exporter-like N-terminal domain-containing protein n=2 Tax=Psychromicrobium lacuslunae TaxID=1618207 RepID=A0A0D4C0V3_9MICC|nr:hypothetical protein UM93_13205 [Psychromicrobium lacuslunae]